MIKAIIFDFGDIFINLDIQAQIDAFAKLGLHGPNPELVEANDLLEKGQISENQFLEVVQKYTDNASLEDIREAWNAIIGDFPLYRLEFLQMLARKYKLFLLTNTDSIHIDRFEHNFGVSFFSDFYRCFEKVFYSHEMGMRKPDRAIFNFILNKYDLSSRHTLFVDDKKINTDAAASLGIHVWNLEVGKEDVVDLFKKKDLPL